MTSQPFFELHEKLRATGRAEVIKRLTELLVADESDSLTKSFLTALGLSIENMRNDQELLLHFVNTAEQHICRGRSATANTNIVRVVQAIEFLCYYSKKFIKIELENRRKPIMSELKKIIAILRSIEAENKSQLQFFLDNVLNLNGRLRRRGYPLWVTTIEQTNNCFVFDDYARKLSLIDATGPAFLFEIEYNKLGNIPNVRIGESDT